MTSTTTVPDDHATKRRVLRAAAILTDAAATALAYAVQVIIGPLVLAAGGARFFVRRSARAAAL
ncbi:hypothetical protein FGW37_07935 [Streptomyces rectiverticillatus]|uniref:hypothetical protein n=1 Tax=Streptomyces rectiverticillatus TaxID=173860 RepID=UPI0015C3F68A|nr:hypothetical protein [Streptomyces rectiverticillatus]QLE71537.1 hypothetical protein FGW37_07935 [Streptomyces rectiverticillatus]